mmetsp:Transcript_32572/g.52782  ORF Transcript_32572/g.52782 Transcript_32572/m.52782 type:complete len:115 (-) Transcript_32572:1036-1380(-)
MEKKLQAWMRLKELMIEQRGGNESSVVALEQEQEQAGGDSSDCDRSQSQGKGMVVDEVKESMDKQGQVQGQEQGGGLSDGGQAKLAGGGADGKKHVALWEEYTWRGSSASAPAV